MFKSKYKLCDLFGIPVYVDFSFLILLLLFVVDGRSFTLGLAMALVLAISVTIHELGHALTARVFGYQAQDITLSLLGGCASFISLPRKTYQEFLTALAGPLVSFLLAGSVFLLDILEVPIENRWLWIVLSYAYWANLMLGGFNLLPGFPMDGGRIFRSVMRLFLTRARATLVAMWVGRGFAILLGLYGVWAMFNGSFGFISILIAVMIWREGYREYQLARVEEDFRKWSQADFDARVSPPPYGRD